MSERKVKLDIQDGVAILTLNDPGALNAVGLEMLEDLADCLTDIEHPDSGVRCVIMTGEGRGFCAGANLQGRGDATPNPNARPDSGSALEVHYHPIMRRIRNLPMPFLTAVNGPAAGVGGGRHPGQGPVGAVDLADLRTIRRGARSRTSR